MPDNPSPASAADADGLEHFKAAVESGDAPGLRALLARQPELKDIVNEPLFSFDAPAIVHRAGDRELVEALLEAGADINARSRWWAGGFGVLDHADAESAAFLIERGAVVDAHAAAHLDMPERLLDLIRTDPAVVNARGGDGQTPLHVAATPEIAALLLDHGAEIEARDVDHGSTPAQYALKERPAVCRLLIERGAEPDIFMACVLGDTDLARRALARDPHCLQARVGQGRFTSGDSDGGHIYLYTVGYAARPLHLAAEHGHRELLDFLLRHASVKDRFLLACIQADAETVRSMQAEHPDLVRSLPPGDMGLIAEAAWSNRFEAVRVMLDAGFDVDARGIHDSTPLDRAAIRGYAGLVDLLLERGASLEVKNEFGGTPLRACLWGSVHFRDPEGDYPETLKRLRQAGAPVPEKA